MFALLTEQVEEIQSDVGGIGDNNLVRVSSVIVKSFNATKPVAKPVLRDRNVSTSRYFTRSRGCDTKSPLFCYPNRGQFGTQTARISSEPVATSCSHTDLVLGLYFLSRETPTRHQGRSIRQLDKRSLPRASIRLSCSAASTRSGRR